MPKERPMKPFVQIKNRTSPIPKYAKMAAAAKYTAIPQMLLKRAAIYTGKPQRQTAKTKNSPKILGAA
jgi:hypothetical protein